MDLTVCETFTSLMGESTLAGLPAFFIRLAGCNLRCRYCDTPYAYDGGDARSVAALVDEAQGSGCGLVLVTGGEPLLQKNTPTLLAALAEAGTGGAHRDQRQSAHRRPRPPGAAHHGPKVPGKRHERS